MKLTNYKKELISFVEQEKKQGKTIGFVPTMGALHAGHLSLIQRARKECDFVVCSIYVNPTQFNDSNDLDNYPRTVEADAKLIENYCDLLFVPNSFVEVYGDEIKLEEFNFGGIENVLEGEFRPGHFQGMANVVCRFFHIVKPHKAYFGSKDYQQFKIVSKLVELIQMDIEIVGCAIVREENGLARSSRNELLSLSARESSSVIFYTLNFIANYHSFFSVKKMKKIAIKMIAEILDVEYLEIRDADTLEKIKNWEDSNEVFVSFAGRIDGVRLIDNVRF